MIEKVVRELSFMCLTSPVKESMRKFVEKINLEDCSRKKAHRPE